MVWTCATDEAQAGERLRLSLVLALLNIYLHRLCIVDQQTVAKLTVPYNISAIPSRESTAVGKRVSGLDAQLFHLMFSEGPLRLLAWEIYDRLKAENLPCNLVTGQELQLDKAARHTACTVEMAELVFESSSFAIFLILVVKSQPIECAVIDEAQMMGSENRGHAFTRAVLGIPATTIHLCGDASTVDLVFIFQHFRFHSICVVTVFFVFIYLGGRNRRVDW